MYQTIKAFHIDMNNARFTRGYLEKWLSKLAGLGYNTIIWEVENNIAWDTCPECVAPDAFEKEEFKEILAYSRDLGLSSICLMQTLGHCEYVLKHDKYRRFAELDDRVDQYCPLDENLAAFLNRWIDEYLEVFGDVKYFHLGMDEAWSLGMCDSCKEYVQQHSIAELYVQHLEKLTQPLLDRGITPMIWADMPLRHPQILEVLNRRIILCDWMYEGYQGCGKVYNWGKMKMQKKDEFGDEFKEKYKKYLFPNGLNEESPNVYYTSDYLVDLGFTVLVCPTSSSFGDSVFAPRLWLHLQNCFDSIKNGCNFKAGFVHTSWTCHVFPYELQDACFELVRFIDSNPDAELSDFRDYYVYKSFGVRDGEDFWNGVDAFSRPGLFMQNHTLRIGKNPGKVDDDVVLNQLEKIFEKGGDVETRRMTFLIESYMSGLKKLSQFKLRITHGKDIIDWWILAGQNLISRVKLSMFLLCSEQDGFSEKGTKILEEMNNLRCITDGKYLNMVKVDNRVQRMHWLYDSCQNAIMQKMALSANVQLP